MEDRVGFSAEGKNTMLISHETRFGFRIAGKMYVRCS